jgi:hypothetical protein
VFFAALALAGCSTNFDTAEVEGSDRKRIYAIDQSRAFQIAHDSIASVLPGRKISKVDGPTKGYSTYSRFMLDTYTQQVLVIPLEGKNEAGETVKGYNLNVSGSGTSVMIGRSKNINLYEEVQLRLAETGSGVLVGRTERRAYEEPVFPSADGPSTNKRGTADTPEERLRNLNDLYQDGLITEEEYQRKRQEVLDDI